MKLLQFRVMCLTVVCIGGVGAPYSLNEPLRYAAISLANFAYNLKPNQKKLLTIGIRRKKEGPSLLSQSLNMLVLTRGNVQYEIDEQEAEKLCEIYENKHVYAPGDKNSFIEIKSIENTRPIKIHIDSNQEYLTYEEISLIPRPKK